MKDRSDDPSHHERTLLPRSYISLLKQTSHRQDNTYHGPCYASRGALAGTRNSSMSPPWRIDPTTNCTMSERSYHGATSRSLNKHPTDRITHTTALVTPVVEHWLEREIAQWVHHEGSIRRPIAPWANTLTTELHLAPQTIRMHQRRSGWIAIVLKSISYKRYHPPPPTPLLFSFFSKWRARACVCVCVCVCVEINKVKKRMLFNKTLQYTNYRKNYLFPVLDKTNQN